MEKRGRGTGCEFGDGGEAKPCVDPCPPPRIPLSPCILVMERESGEAGDMEDE